MLAVENVRKNFGKLAALRDVNLRFEDKSLISIIGPNGAGKTTLVNVITGVLREDQGLIKLDGRLINKLPPNARIKLGVGRTFQIPKPFPNLTVRENIEIGSIFAKKIEKKDIDEEIDRILNLLGLKSLEDKTAGLLNTEQRKMVDLGRALATKPKYLFLDELGAGLAEGEILSLSKLIKKIQSEEGITIIYIGHVMRLVKELDSPIIVFSEGSPIFQGSFEEVVSNTKVIEIYLGDKYAKSQ